MKHLLKNSTVAILIVAAIFSIGQTASAAPSEAEQTPDLTAGGKPDTKSTILLGPTGMRGWIYHQGTNTSKARQILVTDVEAESPAHGKIELGDVILGASGNGKDPAPFDLDARRQLAVSIADAEARNPAELRLLVWRKGKQGVLALKLRTMGAYSATAPFDCPKSAKILEEGLDYVAKQDELEKNDKFGRFDWGLMSLMAGNDPANPKAAGRMNIVRKNISKILVPQNEIDAILGGAVETRSKIPWGRGHNLITLTEYYLQTKDKSVLPSIEACAVSIANGQSIYGTMGHRYQDLPADGSRGSIHGYGPVNSAAMPTLLGLVLARECGIDHPELEPAIQRGATFFGYYAGKGAIPYGEHTPAVNNHETNGKSGLAALIMRRIEGREEESGFFAKMAAASFPDREGGHTGAYFNYQWAPLGAYAGSREALIMHFKHISWHLDLCRRWDGGFEFTMIQAKREIRDYSQIDSSVPPLLTYAAPLRRLMVTGKGLDVELLSKADVEQAEFAALYDASKRTEKELLEDFSCWSQKVKRDAASEITERGISSAKLLEVLLPIAKNPDNQGRVAALWALGKIEDSASARVLAESLTDKDPMIRFVAAESMRSLPQELRMAEVETILKACASTAKPAWPLDPEDPVQFAHGSLSMLLFYNGRAAGPKGVLAGNKVKDIDRSLLYPAIRAVAGNPGGRSRSTLADTYPYLTEEDLEALADTVVTSVVERAPADSMFSKGIRESGVDFLLKFGYVESDEVISLLLEETQDDRMARDIEKGKKAIGPKPPQTFKEISSVTASPSSLRLPNGVASLKVEASDSANVSNIFTWKKLEGPGDAKFQSNGTAEAASTKVSLSAPGNYVLEVTMSDPRGLSKVSETLTLTVEK